MIIECTKENPWNGIKKPGERIIHPDAEEIDTDYESMYGSYEKYKCPHCKHIFWIELPD